jgi:hypothetical protein
MNTEAREAVKAKREILVFKTFIETQTFIEKSGLQIISETVESRQPREPDIVCFCQKKEGKVAFELVELCAEDIARAISAISKGGVIYIRAGDPSPDGYGRNSKKDIRRNCRLNFCVIQQEEPSLQTQLFSKKFVL